MDAKTDVKLDVEDYADLMDCIDEVHRNLPGDGNEDLELNLVVGHLNDLKDGLAKLVATKAEEDEDGKLVSAETMLGMVEAAEDYLADMAENAKEAEGQLKYMWYTLTIAKARAAITRDRIYLDTETTGLDPQEDEILTLSMVDQDGTVLWDKMYKPSTVAEWPAAEAVNGISPEDVADCPHIREDRDAICEVLQSAKELCIYNAPFDLGFLRANGIEPSMVQDVTDVMRQWADRYNDGKWEKLVEAAEHVGFDWGDNRAHSSVGDCHATKAVHEFMGEWW